MNPKVLLFILRGLVAAFVMMTATGCDCWFFKHDKDDKPSQGPSGNGPGGSGGGGGGGTGGGGGGGGGGADAPEIDPSALRGGLAVLVCGTLILVDRRLRTKARPASVA